MRTTSQLGLSSRVMLEGGSVKALATDRHCLHGSNDILEMPHAVPCCEPSEASECCMRLINQHAVAEYFLGFAIICNNLKSGSAECNLYQAMQPGRSWSGTQENECNGCAARHVELNYHSIP